MKSKLALQTLLALALWLVLVNFNTRPQHKPLPEYALGGGKSTYKIKKIVLDAGHGGKDPGCIGAISKEKDNALAIVLKLGAEIKAAFPDMEVIYTRDKDVFIELKERAAIANRNDADLFISVHCNSISVSGVSGAETYVMGLHTAAHNLEVAKRENASIYLEENYEKNYEGYDPNSPEAHILGAMWQSAYLEQSILFAGFVQKFAKSIGKREDKGVKQAGFLVLRETAMPAVLIETGYLTNRVEESYLASEEGRTAMAQSIMEAFRTYKAQLEGDPVQAPVAEEKPAPQPQTKPAPPTPAPKPIAPSYRIFLLSWPSRLDLNSGQLALLSNVKEEKNGNEYHYFVGTFASRQEAEKTLGEIRNLGFKSASIQTSPK